MKIKKLSVFLTVFLCAAMISIPTFAFASGEKENTIKISTSEELINAINSQEDGQTWVLAQGEYDIKDGALEHKANIASNEKGFVFPIHSDNLTIKGEGDVTITSSYKANTGNWNKQNFITIASSNVTIENVKIKGNYNEYYDGCNKVLELVGEGKDLTVKNVEFLPLVDSEGKKSSGSVYINVADAGKTTFENVKMASWISARAVKNGTVEIKNVTQDFTNNVYAGYYNDTYGYAWNPGVSGDNVVIDGFTIQVDSKAEFVQQIMKGLRAGTTIELMEDIEVSEEVYINKVDNITIKGNGHKITAAEDFKKNEFGQINLFKIEANNVSLDNLSLVATSANKHTLDIYASKNVSLNNVVLNHENASSGAPMVINSSDVSVYGLLDLVTGDNSWYAVNMDNKYGEASLVFEKDSKINFTDNSASATKSLSSSTRVTSRAKLLLSKAIQTTFISSRMKTAL